MYREPWGFDMWKWNFPEMNIGQGFSKGRDEREGYPMNQEDSRV